MRLLTVYGDSIAAGYGAPPGRGFVPELSRLAAHATRRVVPLQNYGVPGMTSFELAKALSTDAAFASALTQSATICILIGGDDMIAAVPSLLTKGPAILPSLLGHSASAYARLTRIIRDRSRAPFAVGTLYNPFPNTALAEEIISSYNATVIAPAALAVGAVIAPVHEAFAGRQALLIDGYSDGIAGHPGRGHSIPPVHPNALGHRVIAEVFAPYVQ